MNCQETRALMDGYLDGELDLVRSLEFERHVKECPSCERFQQERAALRAAIRENAPRYRAPENLRKRVESALARSEGASQPRKSFLSQWPMWAAAAAVVVLASIWWARPAENIIEREVVASHVRSLMVSHLTDVPSSDQHTVKPWFAGKLDFSPSVKDFSADGFKLIGGRLDYIGDQPAAALVYQRAQHIINVFMWPARPRSRNLHTGSRNGYNVIETACGGMSCWLVSDLNKEELSQLASLFSSGLAIPQSQ